MMHFASHLALISVSYFIIYAAILDFNSFHSNLSSGEGPVDAVTGAITTVTDGSQVLAEQPPAYIPPPIPSVGSDPQVDLSKETIKQANSNFQLSSFDLQDLEMTLIPPDPTSPLISSMNPQPESSTISSSNPSPSNVGVDPWSSWPAYKDDQSLGSAKTTTSDDWTTQHGCQPHVASKSNFRARQESCKAPKQEDDLEQENVPKQEIVPYQEDRRKKICPYDIITLCCEEKGDLFFLWFPKKCKKCE